MKRCCRVKHLLVFLCHMIPNMQAVQRNRNQGGSGYALSCLSFNCQAKWDPNCCSGSQQGIGRSIKPLANWRFGSIFRNSIPPVRPYNPPTFEDIFETEHERFDVEITTVDPQRFSLQLNPLKKFGKQPNKQENFFKFSNKFDKFSEMDRNSESESTTDKYFARLNRLKEKQHQMLFENKYETSTKPFKKQLTSTQRYEYVKRTRKPNSDFETTTNRNNIYKTTTLKSEKNMQKEIFLQKAKDKLLEKQRLKSLYITQQAKNKVKKLRGKAKEKSVVSSKIKDTKKVDQNPDYFRTEDFQTNFNNADDKKENVKTVKVRKEKKDTSKKSEKHIAYEEKLARWQEKKAKSTKITRQKYIDKSQKTIITDDKGNMEITSPVITMTDSQKTTNKIWPIKEQLTEMFNQEENENEIENLVKEEKGNIIKEKENQDNPFTEELCEKLRVPCRFVTEHACCKLPQRIELLGRARAMDGSADLRWRLLERTSNPMDSDHHNNGGPRNGPQGRMITGFASQSGMTQPSSFSVNSPPNNIHYNHSKSKDRVLVPRYHYDGGPKLTTTILRQCWRLTYLNCNLEPDHPCCALTSAKNNSLIDTMSSNVLDKWLRRQ